MTDAAATATSTDGSADAALAFLTEMSPDLRGAAILDGEGGMLAASGDADAWSEAARELLAAADAADPEPAEQLHVGSETGEVFALRHEGLVAVAVTERFALASLMLFDMRQALRDLANARGGET
jgi:hypothetical protein